MLNLCHIIVFLHGSFCFGQIIRDVGKVKVNEYQSFGKVIMCYFCGRFMMLALFVFAVSILALTELPCFYIHVYYEGHSISNAISTIFLV